MKIRLLLMTSALLLGATACGATTTSLNAGTSGNGTPSSGPVAGPSVAASVCPDTGPDDFNAGGTIQNGPDGLQYVDLVVGTGATAQAGQQASVHYTGWLQSNGSKFDSSRDRGQPFQFTLGAGQVIKGWDLGVAGMKVCGKRKLIIPAAIGYGSQGQGPIPGGATLIFDVSLLSLG